MSRFVPTSLEELRDAVASALAAEEAMEIIGGGSKRGLGRPLQTQRGLDLSQLSGIRDYAPSELVLTAGAATPLAEIERALAEAGQMLAFEPPDWRMLLGDGGEPTIGGILACNLAGPRRIKAGAARDHFLGFRGVSGRGEIFKAGGKVVKNVTGYDLCKLMAGSYGTLAALEEVTVKVLPRPESVATVLCAGFAPEAAVPLMSAALGSPHEVSGAAYLPAGVPLPLSMPGRGVVVALRVEGPAPSVAFRRDSLMREHAAAGFLGDRDSIALWRAIGNAAPLAGIADRAVWRISIAPSRGAEIVAAISRRLDAQWFLDWGGGLVWLAVPEAGDGGAAIIRAAIRGVDGRGTGHATLIKGSPALRRAVAVFEPQPPALAALSRRVKEAFDPAHILNPGRLVEGELTPVQTEFTLTQLADPDTAASEKILRACVHCGFCTATCPTYVLLGDELDSPRGRIYLIKNMLEAGGAPSPETVKHIDRCLSCLACMTTCPSGVHYMHLVDHGRRHIEQNYRRPVAERLLRRALGAVLTRPAWLRFALQAARLARPFGGLMPRQLRPALQLAPAAVPPASTVDRPQIFPAEGKRRMRVALLPGCAQQVLAPQINEATIRLLTRLGAEVVVAAGSGCCGSLLHHLGQEAPALRLVRSNIDAWDAAIAGGGLDAVVANASGCGTMLKDYGFLLRSDPAYADKAARIAALARDVSEVAAELGLGTPVTGSPLRVAYHSACSMQHGQRVEREPRELLKSAGFTVLDVPEGHLCCGWAGTYNLLQPELSAALRERKLANIALTGADIVAAGNLGCITHLGGEAPLPVVHTVELLDWATGGPTPPALAAAAAAAAPPPGSAATARAR